MGDREIFDDIDSLRVDIKVKDVPLLQIRPRLSHRFLKGPIPYENVEIAAALPAKALALNLAATHRSDIAQRSVITLPSDYLERLGIGPNGKSLAIKALCGAGLMKVHHRAPGRTTRVEPIRTPVSADA
jgi:hypothetical protein